MERLLLFFLLLNASSLKTSAFAPSVVRTPKSVSSSSSSLLTREVIFSKRRGRVELDPNTGFYRPVKDKKNKETQGGLGAAWNSFKNVVYEGIDVISSLPQKLRGKNSKKEVDVVDGYSMVQQRVLESSGKSPGEQLMREYQERGVPADLNDEKSTAFDSFKGVVFRTVDAASQLTSSAQKTEEKEETIESFKPVVQASLAASAEVRASLPDLQSENPVRRAFAKWKIKEWERKERQRHADIERQETLRQAKKAFYKVGDAAKWTADGLVKLPGQVSDVAQKFVKFVASTPDMFEKGVDTVAAIPSNTQKIVDDVQQSVNSGIETTERVIEDVKAIPEKVEKTAKETQENVNAAIEAVDEAVTSGKVLLGLEKAKPQPPKVPPPKPLSASEIGWKVAGGLASGTAKVAWWAGKGVAFLAWNGAQMAFKKGAESIQEQQKTAASTTSVSTPSSQTTSSPRTQVKSPEPLAAKVEKRSTTSLPEPSLTKAAATQTVEKKPTPPTEKPPSTVKTEDSMPRKEPKQEVKTAAVAVEKLDKAALDLQVDEALKLAEDALKMANEKDVVK